MKYNKVAGFGHSRRERVKYKSKYDDVVPIYRKFEAKVVFFSDEGPLPEMLDLPYICSTQTIYILIILNLLIVLIPLRGLMCVYVDVYIMMHFIRNIRLGFLFLKP